MYRLQQLFSPAARALLLFPLFILTCTSCTLINTGEAPARLQLHPEMPQTVTTGTKELKTKQITVVRPEASRDIDTDGIVLIFNGREVRHLKGYRWTSPAPDLVLRALVDSLNASNAFSAAAGEKAGLSAILTIQCDLKQFSLFYADEKLPPKAVFDASFRLINFATGKTLSTLPVQVEVPASGTHATDLATASEKALSRALEEVTPWVISSAAKVK